MKTNLDDIYKTSDDLEKNGVWFDLNDKIGFLLRPFKSSNPRVKAAMAKHHRPYARAIEMRTLGMEKELEINVKLFLDICLVDWKGVEIDGQILAFKDTPREVAVKFFCRLPDLFDSLWKHANDFANYKEDLGNS